MIGNTIDPGTAALLGALIGAGSSLTVQIVSAIFTAKYESRKFRRGICKENISSLTEIYEYALNVIYNMQRDGSPDRATRGAVFSQISLRGSSKVVKAVHAFLDLPSAQIKEAEREPIIQAMKEHIRELENDLE